MRRFTRPFILALALIAAPATAMAFEVTPTVSVIELPRDMNGKTLLIENPRDEPLPVIIEIVERDVREDGTEGQKPADELFLVFPPQAVIGAGASQAVRVQWVGPMPQQSRSFTLYAGEVPVDLSGSEESVVQTILRIGASVHVAPEGTRSEAVLVNAAAAGGGVQVTIENRGSRFLYIDELNLDFGGTVVGGRALADAAGRTLIPPAGRRTFVVPGVGGTPTLQLAE